VIGHQILTAEGATNVGLVRRRNEDALYVGTSLIAVADGLGGHVAGDVASSTAIEALKPYDQHTERNLLANTLARAVHSVNSALRARIVAEPTLAGMGTTLVATLWSGRTAALANLGDSRAYLLRTPSSGPTTTTQITEDHTYQHVVAEASIVPTLPERLARFLDGRVDGRSPDITVRTFDAGDRILLCSDGLSSYVPHDAIHEALSDRGRSPRETAERLVDLALEQGGPDNVTVAVIDVGEGC
jgi:serine/threonine protein phosphatase PrpC